MSDENNDTPEGLDDYLQGQPPLDDDNIPGPGVSHSQAIAKQNTEQSLASLPGVSTVQHALDFGGNLDQYHQMVQSAMSGDPTAQQALAEHSLGTATMGTVEQPGGFGRNVRTRMSPSVVTEGVETAPGLAQKAAEDAAAGIETTAPRQAAATEAKSREQTMAKEYARQTREYRAKRRAQIQGFADGGDVPDSTPPPAGLDEFIAPEMKEAQYGAPLEQAKALAEGVGQGVAGPFAPMAEQAFGVKPEDIRARAEVNPITHYAGEIGGLGAGMLSGVGEGALVSKAGEALGAALPAATSTLGKVGSAAAKSALENGVIQGSDELSKFVLQDPNQSTETAMIDVGLAGLLGGAVGSVSPLWQATVGSKVGGMLKAISDKAGGIEGVVPDEINEAIQTSGLNIPPEVRAGLSADPEIRQMFSTLQEASTKSGVEAQDAVKGFKNQLNDAVVSALGKTPEDIDSLSEMSEYEAGDAVKKSLMKDLKAAVDPISNKFEQVKSQFKNTELPEDVHADLATEISQISNNEGYHLSPESPQAKLIQRTLKEIPNLKTLEDVRKYGSIVGDTTSSPELWRIGGQIRKVLRNAEENYVDRTLAETSPEILETHAQARSAYKQAMGTIDNLNDRLHVGRFNGPGSFIRALGEMAPEDVLRRLSPKGDAGIIGELSEHFPDAAGKIKDYHLDQILKSASDKAPPGETINSKSLFNSLEKMSPEMREFLVKPEARDKMNAIQTILNGFPTKLNTSGTAKTMDALMSHLPGSAVGLLTMLMGHNPATGVITGAMTKWLGRDMPDAIRLGLLKFLGTPNKAIDFSNFKAAVDFMHSAVRGETLLNRSVKNIFRPDMEVFAPMHMPTERDRAKLDSVITDLKTDPSPLLQNGENVGHYLPEHGQAVAQLSGSAVQYLGSLKASTDKKSPLDTTPVLSTAQKANYNRALDIAQQPLMAVKHIKDGTLTQQDVTTLKTVYPNLYNRMSSKIMSNIMNQENKGNTIPYRTQMSMSLFLGQPLNSTMSQASILAAQPTQAAQQPPSPGQSTKVKKSTAPLTKLSALSATSSQTRAMHAQKE